MKKHVLKYFAVSTIFLQSAMAQNVSSLKLSEKFPESGKAITFIYEPTGAFQNSKEQNGAVCFLDNNNFPVADIPLKRDGVVLRGTFTIPQTAKAFYLIFDDGKTIDNNYGNGYLYPVYKEGIPVAGALASEAFMEGLGADLAGIRKDLQKSSSLYKEEFRLHPDIEKDYEDMYLLTLPYSNVEDGEIAERRAAKLSASKNEKDLLFAYEFYHDAKKVQKADSILNIIKSNFPNGKQAKNDLVTNFREATSTMMKDSLYHIIQDKYPDDKEDNDGLLQELAIAHLRQNDITGFEHLSSLTTGKTRLLYGVNDVAMKWADNNEHLANAEKLIGEALEIIKSEKVKPFAFQSPKQAEKQQQNFYYRCLSNYAFILYKEHHNEAALKYEQKVYTESEQHDADMIECYASILMANKDYKRAQDILENAISSSVSSASMKKTLAEIYRSINGSDDGFSAYLAALNNKSQQQQQTELAKTMISLKAPQFILKDLKGNLVNLDSLKDKIVVLDFWATWCAPCKASFPGMQQVVDKYKSDPDVKFLFIDTWENDTDYAADVKKFIAANKYEFNVLFDEKGDDGKLSKIRALYGVDGVPTKIVIDKNGNIRFKDTGYNGSTEGLVDKVSSMIQLAKNPGLAN
jgi:thiol-disulfide isomerase/thioredoxin